MFTGTMIDDLITTVKKTEANLATEWRMREELQTVPAFILSQYEMVSTHRPVPLGVA
jgi:hypothetical protein